MRKGQIIRKKSLDGCPIGSYMRVVHMEHGRVYADVLGSDIPNNVLLRNRVCEIKQASLPIPEELLKKLKNGRTLRVVHDVSPKWLRVVYERPEIITFYSLPIGSKTKGLRGIFVIENIRRMFSVVEITVNYEIKEV